MLIHIEKIGCLTQIVIEEDSIGMAKRNMEIKKTYVTLYHVHPYL